MTTSFHEDVFYEFFRPFRHPESQFNIWGGYGLETFGKDYELAHNYSEEHVWTIVDGEKSQWIVPGMHHVNRVCYLLTEVPHNGKFVEFRVTDRPHSLTKVGLQRRMTSLQKLLAVNNS